MTSGTALGTLLPKMLAWVTGRQGPRPDLVVMSWLDASREMPEARVLVLIPFSGREVKRRRRDFVGETTRCRSDQNPSGTPRQL